MEECWDDMNLPPYVPQLELRKVIRKVPPKSSKEAKRKFRENERIRWEKILKAEAEQAIKNNTQNK